MGALKIYVIDVFQYISLSVISTNSGDVSGASLLYLPNSRMSFPASGPERILAGQGFAAGYFGDSKR